MLNQWLNLLTVLVCIAVIAIIYLAVEIIRWAARSSDAKIEYGDKVGGRRGKAGKSPTQVSAKQLKKMGKRKEKQQRARSSADEGVASEPTGAPDCDVQLQTQALQLDEALGAPDKVNTNPTSPVGKKNKKKKKKEEAKKAALQSDTVDPGVAEEDDGFKQVEKRPRKEKTVPSTPLEATPTPVATPAPSPPEGVANINGAAEVSVKQGFSTGGRRPQRGSKGAAPAAGGGQVRGGKPQPNPAPPSPIQSGATKGDVIVQRVLQAESDETVVPKATVVPKTVQNNKIACNPLVPSPTAGDPSVPAAATRSKRDVTKATVAPKTAQNKDIEKIKSGTGHGEATPTDSQPTKPTEVVGGATGTDKEEGPSGVRGQASSTAGQRKEVQSRDTNTSSRDPSGGKQTSSRDPSGGKQTSSRDPSGGKQTSSRDQSGGKQTSSGAAALNEGPLAGGAMAAPNGGQGEAKKPPQRKPPKTEPKTAVSHGNKTGASTPATVPRSQGEAAKLDEKVPPPKEQRPLRGSKKANRGKSAELGSDGGGGGGGGDSMQAIANGVSAEVIDPPGPPGGHLAIDPVISSSAEIPNGRVGKGTDKATPTTDTRKRSDDPAAEGEYPASKKSNGAVSKDTSAAVATPPSEWEGQGTARNKTSNDGVLKNRNNMGSGIEAFGYHFNEDGKLLSKENEPFKFIGQEHYEALGEAITEEVYTLLETKGGLQRTYLPIGAAETQPRSFIFESPDARTSGKLLLLIHGSGVVRAGQWARRLIINHSLESGTQLPYIARAKQEGYGVIVLNTNRNRDENGRSIPENETPEHHSAYVWENIIAPSKATHIDIVAHSYGGVVTCSMVNSFRDEFEERVRRIAFTDSVHSVSSRLPRGNFITGHAVNWVTSTEPLDTELQYSSNDARRVSAGTTVHEETSWKAMESIFAYLTEQSI